MRHARRTWCMTSSYWFWFIQWIALSTFRTTGIKILMDLYKILKRCLCRSSKTLKDLKKFFTRVRYPTFEQLGPEIHANSTFFGEKLISSFCLFISVFFIRVTTNDHKKSNTCTTLFFKMYKVAPKQNSWFYSNLELLLMIILVSSSRDTKHHWPRNNTHT